jgi:hypothetical protein
MHEATLLRQEKVALTGEISIFPSMHGLEAYKRLRRCRRIDLRQCTFDQSQERGSLALQGQRERRTTRVQVLRIRVPVCDHMRKISQIVELSRVPLAQRLLELVADALELASELPG